MPIGISLAPAQLAATPHELLSRRYNTSVLKTSTGNDAGLTKNTSGGTPPPIPPKTSTVQITKPPPSKKEKRGFFTRFLSHGMGVSQITVDTLFWKRSWTPKIPFDTYSPQVDKLPKLKGLPGAPTTSNEYVKRPLLPPPVGSNLAKIGNVDHCRQLIDGNFLVEDLHTGPRNAAEEKTFKQILDIVKARCEKAPDTDPQITRTKSIIPSNFAGAEMTVVTSAVIVACQRQGVGMADAARALACLCNTNLIESIRTGSRVTAPGGLLAPPIAGMALDGNGRLNATQFDQFDHALAWRIAQELADTPVGFTALKKISYQKPPDTNLTFKVVEEKDGIARTDGATDFGPFEHAKEAWKQSLRIKYDPFTEAMNEHDDLMLKTYLTATREKSKELAANHCKGSPEFRHYSDPVSVKASREKIPGGTPETLLDKALLAIEAHLTESALCRAKQAPFLVHAKRAAPTAAETNIDYGAGTSKAEIQAKQWPYRDAQYEWAIAAVRNGVYTDKIRDDDGNLTLFGKMQAQAEKNQKWATRAVVNPEKTFIKRMMERLHVCLVPSHLKSPYHAIALGNKTKTVKKDGKKDGEKETTSTNSFRSGLKGIIRESRQKRELMKFLSTQLKEKNPYVDIPQDDAEHPLSDEQRATRDTKLLRIARIALLDQAENEIAYMWETPHCDALAHHGALERVKKNITKNTTLSEADKKALYGLIDNQGTQPFTTDRLAEWAESCGAPKPGVKYNQLNESGDAPNTWVQWVDDMNRQYGQAPSVNTTDAFKSAAQLGNVIGDAFRLTELGCKTVLANGGTFGFGTKGLSARLSKLALGLVAAIRIDLRAQKSTHSVVEYGNGAQGSEFFIGKQHSWRVQGGLGVQVGVTIPGTGFSKDGATFVNAGVDAAGGYGKKSQEGLMLRLSRTKREIMGDKDNNDRVAEMAEFMMDPKAYIKANKEAAKGKYLLKEGSDDATSVIKNLWQQHPDLSMNWVDTTEKATTVSATARAGIGLQLTQLVRIGMATIGIGYKKTYAGQKHHEKTGTVTMEQISRGNSSTVSVATGIGSILLKQTLENGAGATLDLAGKPLSVTSPGIDFTTAQVDIKRSGSTTIDSIISENGIVHRNSNRIIAYETAAAFADAVIGKLADYASVRVTRHGAACRIPAADLAVETPVLMDEKMRKIRDAALEEKYNKLVEFVQRAIANASPTQVFKEYLELTVEAVDTANTLQSLIDSAIARGDTNSAAEYKKHIKQLYAHPNSWEPTFFVLSDRQSAEQSLQVSAGVLSARDFVMQALSIYRGA